MTVKFKFDYVLNLHNRRSYISAIERDGVDEEIAFKQSLVQINRHDISAITRTSEGGAIITMKNHTSPLLTVEDYDDVIESIQQANIALEIMQNEKVYIFDGFEVDSDELNVVQNWKPIVE